MEMEPCLLCDVNSVPLASGEAPICGSHRQQAHAAFEAAEPILRTHLEQAYGAELDEWVRQGVLHGLTWHLEVRDHPPAPTRAVPWPQPGRLVQFANDRDGVVRLVRERVLKAFEEEVIPHYPVLSLRVGTKEGHTVGVEAAAMREALERLVAELVTVDRLSAALRSLPVDAAARTIIDGTVEGIAEPEGVVAALGVLSSGALTLAFVRQVSAGESILVDPVEVSEQVQGGSGEFIYGWWEIRTGLAEPARQWVELLEGRFPKARRR